MPYGTDDGRVPIATDGALGSRVLAYGKDPANHIALRPCPSLAALPAGTADRAFDAPPLSRRAEGVPDLTAAYGDTVEPTGRHAAERSVGRRLRAALRDFAVRRARLNHHIDQALRASGTAGNIGARPRIELMGCPLVLTEGARPRNDVGSRSAYACHPCLRPSLRNPGGSRSADRAEHRPRRPPGRPGQRVHPEGGAHGR
ncbi:hypothetical protein ACFV23_38500 [Streptomyces sp. NPDC059627]